MTEGKAYITMETRLSSGKKDVVRNEGKTKQLCCFTTSELKLEPRGALSMHGDSSLTNSYLLQSTSWVLSFLQKYSQNLGFTESESYFFKLGVLVVYLIYYPRNNVVVLNYKVHLLSQ